MLLYFAKYDKMMKILQIGENYYERKNTKYLDRGAEGHSW